MHIDYRDTERGAEVAARTEALLNEVLPREREWLGGRGTRSDSDRQAEGEALVEELREEARSRDVFAPQLPGEYGGLGLAFKELLPVFEQAGRSILGTRAMHVAAPDEVHLCSLAKRALDEDEIRPEELEYLTCFRGHLPVGSEQ